MATEGMVTFCDYKRRFFYLLPPHEHTVRFTYEYGQKGPDEGAYITVSGVPQEDEDGIGIEIWTNAEFDYLHGAVPPDIPAEEVPLAQLVAAPHEGGMGTMRNGLRVRTRGLIAGIADYGGEVRIAIRQGDAKASIVLVRDYVGKLPDFVEKNAEIEVEGVFECEYDSRLHPGRAIVGDAYIYVKSTDALRLVNPPSWWTTAHLRQLILWLGGIILAALAWIFLLNMIVKRRTRQLVAAETLKTKAEIESAAVFRERLRLACDLHDDLQQLLAGTMCRIKAGINHLAHGNTAKASGQLAFARQAIGQTQTALRRIIWEMHDSAATGGSLRGLFSHVATRFPQWQGKVKMEFSGREPETIKRYSGVLLMIMQEAVSNALRHGEAEHVRVEVEFRPETISMRVVDDGCGFVPGDFAGDPSRLGLVSMRLRAEQLGGSLTIESAPGRGSSIVVNIPIEKEIQEK